MSDFEKLLYGNYETPAPTETTPKLPSDTGKLSSSLFEASLTTPDTEVENSKFSELLGVPKTVLPKNAKQLAALKENTPEELQRTSPKTAAFLQNADNAKATGLDEIKNLKALEAAHASYTPDAISGFIKDYTSLGLNTPAQAAQKLTDMKQRGVDLTTLPRSKLYDNAGDIIADPIKSFAAGVNVMLSGGVELSRYNPSNRLVNAAIKTFTGVDIADETQAKLTQNFDYWQKQQSGALQATKEEFNKAGAIESMGMLVKNPALMVDQLAQSLPYLIPGGLAAQGGTKAMLAFNSISEAMDAGNSARQEAIAAGASPEQQNKSAALAALITMPLAFLGNWLVGTGKIEADFLTQGSTGHNLLSTMLREAFSGAMEEGGNTFGTNVGAKGYDPTRELFANVGKSAAVGGLLESVHGAGMSGLSKFLKDTNGVTVNNTEQTDKAAEATTAFSTLETLGAQAAESGLRGRSPELFQKFIEQMTEDSALTDVYVDAAVLSSVLEKNPTDWNVTAPDLALEVAQATANGGDARISVADYLTFVAGTPIEPAILQDLRTKPDGLTYKESTEFFQQQKEIFAADIERVVSQNTLVLPEAEYTKQKEAGATLPETYEQYVAEHANTRAVYDADVKTVEDKILGEFTKAARFTAPVNRSYTAPIVEFYKTQAKRFNVAPSKLFAEYPINIQAFLGRDGTNELSQERALDTPLVDAPENTLPPNTTIRQAAINYAKSTGAAMPPQLRYVKANPERGARIAAEYEAMVHNPDDPTVKAAYAALIEETIAQYQLVKQMGLKVEVIEPGQADPYPVGPRQAVEDIQNGHLWFFPTESGFGSEGDNYEGNPLLAPTTEKIGDRVLLANDVLRIVHDVFGHAKEGVGFGPNGEENAWQSHVRMYSPLAARAMTTETRGQNSWVNFGTHGEANRANQKATVYAPQKTGLLPKWVSAEGVDNQPAPTTLEDFRPENLSSLMSKPNWAIMTAENPNAIASPEQNPEFMAKLKARLDAEGIEYLEVDGQYEQAEKSVILLGVSPEQALQLGKDFGQQSVLTKDGLIYQDGSRSPATGSVEVFDETPQDYYTTVTFPDGTKSQFSVGINFDQKIEAGQVEPIKPEMIGSLPERPEVYQGGTVGLVAPIVGVHYSNEQRPVLDGSKYGVGTKGAEAERVKYAKDARLKQRLYFYVDEGNGIFPEYGVGTFKHTVKLDNMYDGARNPLNLGTKNEYGQRDLDSFESMVIDAGFDGYYVEKGFGRQGVAMLLGDAAKAVVPNEASEVFQSTFYSALTQSVEQLKQAKAPASQWKSIIKNMAGVKADEIEAVGVNEWLDLQEGSVTKEDLLTFLNANGVQVTEAILGDKASPRYDIEETDIGEFDVIAVDEPYADGTPRVLYTGTERSSAEDYVNEITNYGVEISETKYDNPDFRVAGGENYKELMLSLPNKNTANEAHKAFIVSMVEKYKTKNWHDLVTANEDIKFDKLITEKNKEGTPKFKSSHFDQANILAHVRFDERIDAEGKRVLFINEIQSDWGQKGKKEGFKKGLSDADNTRFELLKTKKHSALTQQDVSDLLYFEAEQKSSIPTAPFVTNTDAWVGLAFKRMLQYATDNGFDKIAIVNGGQAAGFYALSKQVDELTVEKSAVGTYKIRANLPGGRSQLVAEAAKEAELERLVGKDMAAKLIAQDVGGEVYDGESLKVGGEGMKAFYDVIVPKVARNILKKLGGELNYENLSDGRLVTDGDGNSGTVELPQYTVTLTPELKAKVKSGLPLFQGERGSFNVETLTMTLLKGADLSTVIHESGHFYLKMLENLAARPDAPADIIEDFQKAMAWFGVDPTQWSSMTLEQQRPYHEQWAESFERWNLEGVAPTQQLQPMFSRFRAWLLAVYTSVEDFIRSHPAAGKLNNEVRGVFSRLVAAESAIKETEAARAYQPLFKSAEEAGVSAASFAAYLSIGEQATRDATDSMQTRSLRDMRWLTNARNKALKTLQATAKDARTKIEAEVTEEVNREPLEMARSFLRTGETTAPNGDAVKVTKGFRLNTKAIAEMYPSSMLARPDLTKLNGLTSSEGLDPDIIARMFGEASGDALIRALINAEPKASKIEGLTDQRMLEEYGDLTDSRSIQRAADEEVHNEARARFMATGLKMLTHSPVPVSQMTKAAKQAAESAIANKRVRDLRPAQYLAAETRANKAVLKALPKDPDAAGRAQRTALLNNRLAVAAQDATLEVEKSLKYLAKFNNEGTRKNLDLEYLEQIDALLEPFDLRKGLSLKTIDARTSLGEWVAAQEAQGFEPTIDAEEVARLRQKSYKDMSVEEVRGLVDTVKQIEHMGRLIKKLLTAQERADFKERIDEAKASIATNANRVAKEHGTPSDVIGLMGQWGRQMMAAHRKFSSFMRELDGGKNNGALFNLLVRPMGQAGNIETQMKADATGAIGQLFEPIMKELGVLGNLYAKKRVVDGTNLSMTHENRIMFGMNWGNEGNRQRLLDGGMTGKKAISPAEAQAVLNTLTEAEWTFIQGVLDYIETFKPMIEAQERTLTGKTPLWVEASEIQTKFGVFRGGYFPAMYDGALSTRSASLDAASDIRLAMKGAFGSAATRNSHTKARAAEVVGRPILLNFNAIPRHVNQVVHRLAWQPWLIDASRIVRALDSDFRTSLGAEPLTEIRKTIEDLAAGDVGATTPVEVALNRIRNGTSIVGMGWKIMTALAQPLGLANSWARIGSRHMSKGLVQYLGNPILATAWVSDNSLVMRNRGRTMNREMNEILNTVRAGKKASALTGSYFYLIGKFQRTVDVPTYLGAFDKALEELAYESAGTAEERHTIEQTAHAIAGQTVLDVQGGGELKDLARVQRGSPLGKLFTNFYSFMNTVYNLNVEAYRTTDFKNPTEIGVFAADILLINVVPVILLVALKNMAKGTCEWDDFECLIARYKSEQISNLFGQLLLLRELGTTADALTGGKTYGYTGPAGVRFFADALKTSVQASQGELDEAFLKSANNTAGALFHYPAGAINNFLDGAVAIENGEVEGVSMFGALIAGAP